MQSYDLIMLIVLGAAAAFGAWKGLAWQVASVLSMFASYLVAYQFRDQLATKINAPAPWNMFLAMLILFLGTGVAVWIGFALVRKTIDSLKLKDFDRHVGALLGLVKGGLLCIIITFFALMLLGPQEKQAIVNSYSGHVIARVLNKADAVLPREVHAVLDPYINRLEDQLETGAYSVDGDGFAAPSPEFKLSREAAAMRTYTAEEELRRR
jgi:membrane protein required for colicin V production